MSQPTPTTKPNEVETVAALTRQTMTPHQLEPGHVYAIVTATGHIEQYDLTGNEYLPYPARKTGTVTVDDVASFDNYWAKHANDASDCYANLKDLTVTAILDAHTSTGARWQEHILRLRLTHTPAWKAWKAINGVAMTQTAFAEFIEDHRATIVTPDAATMLEIVQTMQGTTGATFKAATRLRDGNRILTWVESTDASAGRDGELPIPETITLRLPVFVGDTYAEEITARLRYRIESGGKLSLTVLLNDVDDHVRAAFDAVVNAVADTTGATIMRGTAS